jgi:hypothetical protein
LIEDPPRTAELLLAFVATHPVHAGG